MVLEVNKHRVKVQYDKSIHSMRFSEGDLVLLWDQAKEPLGAGKFNPMCHGPYVIHTCLNMCSRRVPMSWCIMKGQPWRSLEIGCILKITLRDLQPRLIIVY